jgi:putative flippase GtrA
MGKQARFIAAGVFNTLVDFAIFNALIHVFGFRAWIANICSTSVAMIISFVINKKAVFRDSKRFSHTQFAGYIVVTLAGLWGLQTVVIVGVSDVVRPVAQSFLSGATVRFLVPNIAKAIATIGSAVWNYFWYDRVIFAGQQQETDIVEWL